MASEIFHNSFKLVGGRAILLNIEPGKISRHFSSSFLLVFTDSRPQGSSGPVSGRGNNWQGAGRAGGSQTISDRGRDSGSKNISSRGQGSGIMGKGTFLEI